MSSNIAWDGRSPVRGQNSYPVLYSLLANLNGHSQKCQPGRYHARWKKTHPNLRLQPCLERILICTSGLEVADPVIEMGARLARPAHARPTLLYVTIPIPTMYTGLSAIEEKLTDLLQTDTPVAQHLRHAVVSEEILREAQTGNYDLIILGASQSSIKLTGW